MADAYLLSNNQDNGVVNVKTKNILGLFFDWNNEDLLNELLSLKVIGINKKN